MLQTVNRTLAELDAINAVSYPTQWTGFHVFMNRFGSSEVVRPPLLCCQCCSCMFHRLHISFNYCVSWIWVLVVIRLCGTISWVWFNLIHAFGGFICLRYIRSWVFVLSSVWLYCLKYFLNIKSLLINEMNNGLHKIMCKLDITGIPINNCLSLFNKYVNKWNNISANYVK